MDPQNNAEKINKKEQQNPQNKAQSKTKLERKYEPLIFYFFNVFTIIGTALQLFMVLAGISNIGKSQINQQLPDKLVLNPAIISAAIVLICIINSIYMGGLKITVCSFIKLDKLNIISICHSAMVIAVVTSFTIPFSLQYRPFQIWFYCTTIIAYLSISVNIKTTLKACKWNKKKLFLFKISCYAVCCYYLYLGIGFTMEKKDGLSLCHPCVIADPSVCQESCTSSKTCCYNIENKFLQSMNSFFDMVIMTTGTGLAFISEIIGEISDQDGTSELQIHYTIGINQQQLQTLKMPNDDQPPNNKISNSMNIIFEQTILNNELSSQNNP